MESHVGQSNISYHEYRAIAQLVQAHVDEHQNRFRAMVAFGGLVVRGDTVDIDLLEVVEGWQGKRFWQFSSSAELPLRGQLRLYILAPEEFEDPHQIMHPDERKWLEDLLRRVRQGYEVITEIPPGYARAVLECEGPYAVSAAPPSGMGHSGSPLHLSRQE